MRFGDRENITFPTGHLQRGVLHLTIAVQCFSPFPLVLPREFPFSIFRQHMNLAEITAMVSPFTRELIYGRYNFYYLPHILVRSVCIIFRTLQGKRCFRAS